MSRMEVTSRPTQITTETSYGSHRKIPILPSSNASTSNQDAEPMDITPPASAKMPPPKNSSPETEREISPTSGNGSSKWSRSSAQKEIEKSPSEGLQGSSGTNSQNNVNAAVAAQTQQPKVVQTAFIHKLYNMLEDQSISHLICWSASGESFVMAPTHEFSKVLSSYFKHTNISSFVRQLNMYGFHKVSDVFHTAGSETMWEFKHGNGSFRRGDTASLRDIKRRASRHSLISRETFQPPSQRHPVPPTGAPAEPSSDPDHRLTSLEYSLQDMHNRMRGVEDSNSQLSARCAWLSETLSRYQQWNGELCQIVTKLTSDRDGQLYREASNLQRDIASANVADPYDSRNSCPPPSSLDPVSPRQGPVDDRRSSLSSSMNQSPYRQSFTRPPLPHPSISPRKYGSVSGSSPGHPPSSSGYSPTTPTTANNRPPLSGAYTQYTHPGLPLSHAPHPLSSVAEPGQSSNPASLTRRHTSADIRANEGWQQAQAAQAQGNAGPVPALPPLSGHNGGHWPPSPVAPHLNQSANQHDQSAQELRNTLNSFQFGRRPSIRSRPNSPPPPDRDIPPVPPIGGPFASHNGDGGSGGGWGFGGPVGRDAPKSHTNRFADAQSAPPTRRSSLASGALSSLLNPADTAERSDEEDGMDERKRKRRA